MNEKEKDIIKTMAEALPKMSEMDKGYFLGYAEAMVAQKDKKEEKERAAMDKEVINNECQSKFCGQEG